MATDMQMVALLKKDLTDSERTQFDLQLAQHSKNPTTALILSLLFGYFGIDRFYVGDIGLGVLKMLTLGGFFVWALIDLFLIMGAARKKNLRMAEEVRASIVSIRRGDRMGDA
ncbi:MAG TPA: TM2 domain-containing protein [Polyangia bacterium]|nr:TM2 domain-containing protein [Polyangia bacterium]